MLSDESDVDDIHTLTINEHYAKAFEYRKEREELAKLKEKYGSDVDEGGEGEEEEDSDSEEAESEDEDGEELTPAMDAAILRTLARIKRKDPEIYESKKDVFEEERQRTGEAGLTSKRAYKDKSRPLTMRQHALASVLEVAGTSRSPSPELLTHTQEQKRLREETLAAFHTTPAGKDGTVEASDDDNDDDLLVLREKTKDEIEEEDKDYRAFLQREVGEDLSRLITVDDESGEGGGGEDTHTESGSPKKSKKSKGKTKSTKGKQEENQEFLMNYILNRGWIDHSERRLPTYKEITGSSKGKRNGTADSESGEGSSEDGDDEGVPSDDDEFDEVADRFESSYNFRFEEPGAAEISRHPRNLPSLVRRQDTSRKEAREKRKSRKEEELLKKKEEVKRLKALKLKEINAKLERIGLEGGKKLGESTALQALDLDGDWDPDAHDRQMAELYENDDDGSAEGDYDYVDEEKPTWDDDIDITDIIPVAAGDDNDDDGSKKRKKKKKKKGDSDAMDDGVDVDDMDAEVEQPAIHGDEEWDGTEDMRKRKLEEYMDEIYALDFNDMVGDMPTRFHYTKVESQNFGLTPTEILMATDAELNTYMGIKKYAPYRKEGKGRNWDGQRVARLKDLKQKLKERGVDGAGRLEGFEATTTDKKKRKGKKERMREKAAVVEVAPIEMDMDEEASDVEKSIKEKVKREREEKADDGGEETAKRKRRRHRKSAAVVS